jgi:hypothetical protein
MGALLHASCESSRNCLRMRIVIIGDGRQVCQVERLAIMETDASSSLRMVILTSIGVRRPNGLSLSCTARAHVPKPTRHGGCR